MTIKIDEALALSDEEMDLILKTRLKCFDRITRQHAEGKGPRWIFRKPLKIGEKVYDPKL